MWRVISSRRRFLRLDRAGITSLEFALVSVLLFTLMFGIADLARYFLAWHGLNTIASEAARTWMVGGGSTYSCAHPTGGTAATVAAAAPFLDPNQMTLCVTLTPSSPTVGQAANLSVTASYPFSFMMVGLTVANATLTASTALSFVK